MCGICGFVFSDAARPAPPGLIDRMTDALAHRGPDDRGTFAEPGCTLGHRRLSIIDLSPAGHQPLTNEDGSLQIVFNGEIYNYRDLRPGREQAGHRFRSASDTEVILHLYEQLGEACLEQLRGMFAFAIWDRRRRLFAARDRVGKKPLVYAPAPGGDEAFGGYQRYLADRLISGYLLLPRVLREAVLRRAIEALPGPRRPRGFVGRLKRFVAAACPAALKLARWRHPRIQKHIPESQQECGKPRMLSLRGAKRRGNLKKTRHFIHQIASLASQ